MEQFISRNHILISYFLSSKTIFLVRNHSNSGSIKQSKNNLTRATLLARGSDKKPIWS